MLPLSASEAAGCLLLAWASASDLRTRTIPNACSLGGAVLAGLLSLAGGADPAPLAVVGTGVALFFGLAASMRPAALGAGDAKLAVLVAAMLGPPAVGALLLGLLAALAWAVAATAISLETRLCEVTMPLAPFLAAGAATTLAVAA